MCHRLSPHVHYQFANDKCSFKQLCWENLHWFTPLPMLTCTHPQLICSNTEHIPSVTCLDRFPGQKYVGVIDPSPPCETHVIGPSVQGPLGGNMLCALQQAIVSFWIACVDDSVEQYVAVWYSIWNAWATQYVSTPVKPIEVQRPQKQCKLQFKDHTSTTFFLSAVPFNMPG